MNVIILCAGYATRLYPLTENTPKPLLEVAGKTIIEHLLVELEDVRAITSLNVVTNDKFYAHFCAWRDGIDASYPIEIINDKTTCNDDRLGAIGDINFTITKRDLAHDDVLIIAGDNLFDFNLGDFCVFAQEKRPATTIAVYDVKDKALARNYGLVSIDDDQKVTKFVEKPPEPETTLASLAVYYYPKESIALVKRYIEEGNNTDQPGHYIHWLVENDTVFAFTFSGTWFDVGDFESLEKANQYYSTKKGE